MDFMLLVRQHGAFEHWESKREETRASEDLKTRVGFAALVWEAVAEHREQNVMCVQVGRLH